MSSLIIKSLPNSNEIPKRVAEDLVGLEIGLCSPQNIMCIGFKKPQKDIADMLDALPVSPESLISSLRLARKNESASWFEDKFKHSRHTPNGQLILISKKYCEYIP